MNQLTHSECSRVSGAKAITRVIGGMYHKDAHSQPGGLYGPGGQLYRDAQWVEHKYGVDVMTLLAHLVYEANKPK
ncbi:MAG: hypothetical protein OIF51_05525 [Cellvibrionaceae bacterium]|nr:hypothetical protein [Cellvibrionaceae bacterium]